MTAVAEEIFEHFVHVLIRDGVCGHEKQQVRDFRKILMWCNTPAHNSNGVESVEEVIKNDNQPRVVGDAAIFVVWGMEFSFCVHVQFDGLLFQLSRFQFGLHGQQA